MKQIIAQGAEAILIKDNKALIKDRIKKGYRPPSLDMNLRKKRTRHEARIIEKASKFIQVPKIINTDDFQIEMDFIEGKKLSEFLDKATKSEKIKICKEIGKNISKLHEHDIIHGDLTTSNMIWSIYPPEKRSAESKLKQEDMTKPHTGSKLYFIDFGLSFHSARIEDKAVDLHLLKQALESKHFQDYDFLLKECLKNYKWSKSPEVLKQLEKVESRGRYKGKH
jgi:TP53 regulating kinase and related kinases